MQSGAAETKVESKEQTSPESVENQKKLAQAFTVNDFLEYAQKESLLTPEAISALKAEALDLKSKLTVELLGKYLPSAQIPKVLLGLASLHAKRISNDLVTLLRRPTYDSKQAELDAYLLALLAAGPDEAGKALVSILENFSHFRSHDLGSDAQYAASFLIERGATFPTTGKGSLHWILDNSQLAKDAEYAFPSLTISFFLARNIRDRKDVRELLTEPRKCEGYPEPISLIKRLLQITIKDLIAASGHITEGNYEIIKNLMTKDAPFIVFDALVEMPDSFTGTDRSGKIYPVNSTWLQGFFGIRPGLFAKEFFAMNGKGYEGIEKSLKLGNWTVAQLLIQKGLEKKVAAQVYIDLIKKVFPAATPTELKKHLERLMGSEIADKYISSLKMDEKAAAAVEADVGESKDQKSSESKAQGSLESKEKDKTKPPPSEVARRVADFLVPDLGPLVAGFTDREAELSDLISEFFTLEDFYSAFGTVYTARGRENLFTPERLKALGLADKPPESPLTSTLQQKLFALPEVGDKTLDVIYNQLKQNKIAGLFSVKDLRSDLTFEDKVVTPSSQITLAMPVRGDIPAAIQRKLQTRDKQKEIRDQWRSLLRGYSYEVDPKRRPTELNARLLALLEMGPNEAGKELVFLLERFNTIKDAKHYIILLISQGATFPPEGAGSLHWILDNSEITARDHTFSRATFIDFIEAILKRPDYEKLLTTPGRVSRGQGYREPISLLNRLLERGIKDDDARQAIDFLIEREPYLVFDALVKMPDSVTYTSSSSGEEYLVNVEWLIRFFDKRNKISFWDKESVKPLFSEDDFRISLSGEGRGYRAIKESLKLENFRVAKFLIAKGLELTTDPQKKAVLVSQYINLIKEFFDKGPVALKVELQYFLGSEIANRYISSQDPIAAVRINLLSPHTKPKDAITALQTAVKMDEKGAMDETAVEEVISTVAKTQQEIYAAHNELRMVLAGHAQSRFSAKPLLFAHFADDKRRQQITGLFLYRQLRPTTPVSGIASDLQQMLDNNFHMMEHLIMRTPPGKLPRDFFKPGQAGMIALESNLRLMQKLDRWDGLGFRREDLGFLKKCLEHGADPQLVLDLIKKQQQEIRVLKQDFDKAAKKEEHLFHFAYTSERIYGPELSKIPPDLREKACEYVPREQLVFSDSVPRTKHVSDGLKYFLWQLEAAEKHVLSLLPKEEKLRGPAIRTPAIIAIETNLRATETDPEVTKRSLQAVLRGDEKGVRDEKTAAAAITLVSEEQKEFYAVLKQLRHALAKDNEQQSHSVFSFLKALKRELLFFELPGDLQQRILKFWPPMPRNEPVSQIARILSNTIDNNMHSVEYLIANVKPGGLPADFFAEEGAGMIAIESKLRLMKIKQDKGFTDFLDQCYAHGADRGLVLNLIRQQQEEIQNLKQKIDGEAKKDLTFEKLPSSLQNKIEQYITVAAGDKIRKISKDLGEFHAQLVLVADKISGKLTSVKMQNFPIETPAPPKPSA